MFLILLDVFMFCNMWLPNCISNLLAQFVIIVKYVSGKIFLRDDDSRTDQAFPRSWGGEDKD